MVRLFIICMMLISCQGKSMQEVKSEAVAYEKAVFISDSDTLLSGIQHKIIQVFVQSMMVHDAGPINKLEVDLDALSKVRKNNLIVYWQSYLRFYKSIFYVSIDDKKNGEKACNAGIEALENLKGKNAEDYALLAMLQGFSFQFSSGMKAPFIAKKVAENLEAAMAIDSSNIRVNYVMANNDFYTPEKYGGGTKVERFALKAISLPGQKVQNDYLPSWGKEEAYETLIKFYIRSEKWDLAKKYFKEANEVIPGSYLIGQLAQQLVDK